MADRNNPYGNVTSNEPIYPAINMYSSSRVANQRVNNSKIPLLKYREPIRINDCSKSFDSEFVETGLLRKFETKDGLIHSIKMMKKELPEVGNIKVLICVCMYNESRDAINLTLNGIYQNISQMRNQGLSEGDVAVVLIQDGILKLVDNRVKRTYVKGEKSMVKFYQMLDANEKKPKCDLIQRINIILDETENYNRRGMSKKVNNNKGIPPSIQKNIALVYQNIWNPSKTHFADSTNKSYEDAKWGLRLFSCFKHTNGTKLSSHLWFFEGFCRYLKPQFCVLLDVGTTPAKEGLVNLIRGFSGGPNIGGVSGFMSVDTDFQSEEAGSHGAKQDNQNCCTKNVFSIERAQQYEYILSHFLDKNQQSALGFLHVLPGAWSAYRYQALIKSEKYEPNLLERSYFKIVLNQNTEQKDYRQANMYLAEDRILSLGIYCQMDSKYLLRYVPDAVAFTDPMKSHQDLMSQRRRWINSSLFAFMYVYKNYYYNVMDSSHSFYRKFCTLNLSMIIALLSNLNTYITPALYFFILYATIYQLGFPGAEWVAKLVCGLYTMVFFVGIGGALTGKAWTKRAHVVSVVLALFQFLMIFLVVYNVFIVYLRITRNPMYTLKPGQVQFTFEFSGKNGVLVVVLIISAINLVCFFLILLVHIPTHCGFVCKILLDTPSYIAYTGAYSQTMVIHAFCNVDDVSWGTKGSSGDGKNKFEVDKVFFVGTWLITNAILAFIFLYIDIISRENGAANRGDVVLVAVAVYGTVFMLLKTALAIYHQFKWMCCVRCCSSISQDGNKRLEKIDDYWRKQYIEWKNQFQKKSFYDIPSVINKKPKA